MQRDLMFVIVAHLVWSLPVEQEFYFSDCADNNVSFFSFHVSFYFLFFSFFWLLQAFITMHYSAVVIFPFSSLKKKKSSQAFDYSAIRLVNKA